ncbi:hypothetical protein Dimus_027600 [Dionaea muscipula]
MSLTKLGTMSMELGYRAEMAFYCRLPQYIELTKITNDAEAMMLLDLVDDGGEVHLYIGDAIGSQEIKTPTPQTPHLVDVELGEEANYNSDENWVPQEADSGESDGFYCE